MTAPRKVFRIEQTAAARLDERVENTQVGLHEAAILKELSALRAVLAASARRTNGSAAPARAEVARLTSELNVIAGAINGSGGGRSEERAGGEIARAPEEPPQADAPASSMTRMTHELCAVVNGTEQATQKILAAAEEIDTLAANLSAALQGKVEQGSAQDISDLVVRIFEACNFQDLIGQRVGKVMATLKFIEDHIARVLDEIKNTAATARPDGTQSLYGPRLDGDLGHASQGDIDTMFAG